MKNKPKNIEGYWYSETMVKYNPKYKNYPKPIPNVLTEEEAKNIYNLIVEKEKEARVIHYRGYSESRITGERLGSTEYWTKDWLWPDSFSKHYVLDHKVKPTDEFLKYIGYVGSN